MNNFPSTLVLPVERAAETQGEIADSDVMETVNGQRFGGDQHRNRTTFTPEQSRVLEQGNTTTLPFYNYTIQFWKYTFQLNVLMENPYLHNLRVR